MNILDLTIRQIESEFNGVKFHFYKDCGCATECEKEEAGYIIISGFTETEGFMYHPMKVNKNKEFKLETFYNKINKENVFINLSTILDKIDWVKNNNFFPTSYGIGVDTFMIGSKVLDNRIKLMEDFLSGKGIKYYTEYSNAYFVYRFKISKCEKNINILNSLI